MRVTLTDDPDDLGVRPVFSQADCACDCQCACPTDGTPVPVLSLPVAYYLELTPACNSRCPGCGNVYAGHRAALPAPLGGDEWCDVIARLASHACHFKLTGGETTLHPALGQIVHAIEDLGVPFTLFTNGMWSQPGALIRLLAGAITCEGLLVSLHGPDAATHEAFSGVPGSFDVTVANIRRAAHAGLHVATSVVITRRNWAHIEDVLDQALSLGANQVVCNRFIGAPVAGVSPSQEQLRAAVAAVESLRAAGRPIRFGNCIPQCFAVSSSRGCTAGSTFATIDPWGRVRPCNHAPFIAGDLRTQSAQEVWLSQRMVTWRSLVPADCAHCPAFAACHGGCRAQALLTGQDRDPLIRGPLVEAASPPGPDLPLFAGLRPVGQFTCRLEGGIQVLLHRSQVIPVPIGHDRPAPNLDGSLTLRHIERRYGHAFVDWIGALHQQGLVTWSASGVEINDQ